MIRFWDVKLTDAPPRLSWVVRRGRRAVAVPFAEALDRIRSPGCGACRFRFDPASFMDEDDYARLGRWYAEAVAALSATDGPPLDPPPRVAEPVAVDRVACWRRPGGMAFALLWWGDNTRVRYLEIGVAARGTVFAGCWAGTAGPG
jgi:hypothetical protein